MTRQTTPTPAKAWSYLAGEKGRNRVRVYERAPYGLWIDYRTEQGRVRHPLGYSNRDRAKREADTIAAQFGNAPARPEPRITLQTLFDMYVKEVSPRKSTGKQKHDARCAVMFAKCFGADRLPLTLAKRDFDRFVDERRSGRLSVGKRRTGVGNCMIGYDLRMLNALFNWATVAGDRCGGVLLARNPFKGFPIPKETSPRRPVATDGMYQAMRKAAGKVSAQFEALLVLAHETGHRGQSLRMLRSNDVNFEAKTLRWRSAHDKIGFEHVTPLSDAAMAVLERLRKAQSTIGEAWLFPSPEDGTKPLHRRTLSKWWKATEALAGLDEVKGRGLHSLRRKFATEMKDTPLRDLAHLGGWKCTNTVVMVYQQPDDETMRAALSRRTTLKSVATGTK